jgi:hypothetical protein
MSIVSEPDIGSHEYEIGGQRAALPPNMAESLWLSGRR